jgi:hypothetical protein
VRILLLSVTLLFNVLIASQPALAQSNDEQPAHPTTSASPVTANAEKALERPTAWGEPTDVGVGIYLIDVDTVDSANQNFSASVYYEVRWKADILKHQGPGPKIVPITSVWTPRLTIVNQQQAWNAFPSAVEIYPDGEVVYRQKTWGWFSQSLDLRDFPLDQQTLSIHLVAAGLLQTDVTLTPLLGASGRGSGIAETFSLPDFKVTSWTAESRAYFPFKGEAGTAGFIMEVKVVRQPDFYIWKIIVPLCLIVAMSWVPRWMDPKEVGTNLAISTTSFLTLVAYLFATTSLLPKVVYFTRIDGFILLSTFMVFFGLAHTVGTSWSMSRGSGVTAVRVNIWSRALYPLALVGVLALSFFV